MSLQQKSITLLHFRPEKWRLLHWSGLNLTVVWIMHFWYLFDISDRKYKGKFLLKMNISMRIAWVSVVTSVLLAKFAIWSIWKSPWHYSRNTNFLNIFPYLFGKNTFCMVHGLLSIGSRPHKLCLHIDISWHMHDPPLVLPLLNQGPLNKSGEHSKLPITSWGKAKIYYLQWW